MWTRLPLGAAVLALCACNSAPTLRFPTGSGDRLPINGAIRPADSPYTSSYRSAAAPLAARFHVRQGDETLVAVLSNWARTANLTLAWTSVVDHPVTPQIRAINRPVAFAIKGKVIQVRQDVSGTSSRKGKGRSAAPLASPPPALSTEPVAITVAGGSAPAMAALELSADALFAFGSANLSAQGRRTVADAAQRLLDHRPSGSIVVVGHADRFGAETANAELALRRAMAVKVALLRAAPTMQIQAESRGAGAPLVDCPGTRTPAVVACLSPNRRITLSLADKALHI